MLKANTLIRTDFASFVCKAFRHTHDVQKLGDPTYIDYLCFELQRFINKKGARLVVNLPPRHLKTYMCSIFLSAWTLGRQPSSQILVVTYSDQLAEFIAYKVRSILKASWFKAAFKTRLAEDRTKVTDFATEQGGGLYAASVDGSITGRGADLLIFDDPLAIKDAGNIEKITQVNTRFDSVVMSRLDNPKEGHAIIVAHRLNEIDLSGHLHAQGGWSRIELPMIASRTKTYDLGYETWRRKKGELLRRDAFGKKEIKRLKKNALAPDFETLYQQNPGGAGSLSLKRRYFQTYEAAPSFVPVVLSIDTGQRSGPTNSYSAIQAWCNIGLNYYLVGLWREQCNYEQLRSMYWWFVRNYRPVAALVEATAMGPQLIAEARRRPRLRVVEIIPDGRSKAERFVAHLRTFKRNHIYLPEVAEWREPYIAEFLEFPTGKFDDQVDATTQYLDWIKTNLVRPIPEDRAVARAVNSSLQPIPTYAPLPISQCRGGILSRGRRG